MSLTILRSNDIIFLALIRKAALERYRSGHNEAVLKTVCPQGRMGSNPILSAWFKAQECGSAIQLNIPNDSGMCISGEVPKLAEGTPLERVQVVNSGARVQIPPSPLG